MWPDSRDDKYVWETQHIDMQICGISYCSFSFFYPAVKLSKIIEKAFATSEFRL